MAMLDRVGSNGAAWYSSCQCKKGGSDVVGTVGVGTVEKSVQTGTEEIGAEGVGSQMELVTMESAMMALVKTGESTRDIRKNLFLTVKRIFF
jgi:hypothetical protein